MHCVPFGPCPERRYNTDLPVQFVPEERRWASAKKRSLTRLMYTAPTTERSNWGSRTSLCARSKRSPPDLESKFPLCSLKRMVRTDRKLVAAPEEVLGRSAMVLSNADQIPYCHASVQQRRWKQSFFRQAKPEAPAAPRLTLNKSVSKLITNRSAPIFFINSTSDA
jgi:hypothetical protein